MNEGTLEELVERRQQASEAASRAFAEADRLKKQIEDLQLASDPTCHFAVVLHDATCKHNHTDGCGWYYEIEGGIHVWNSTEHMQYYRKAALILSTLKATGIDAKTAITVVEAIKGA